jgi:hypothetical protein
MAIVNRFPCIAVALPWSLYSFSYAGSDPSARGVYYATTTKGLVWTSTRGGIAGTNIVNGLPIPMPYCMSLAWIAC